MPNFGIAFINKIVRNSVHNAVLIPTLTSPHVSVNYERSGKVVVG